MYSAFFFSPPFLSVSLLMYHSLCMCVCVRERERVLELFIVLNYYEEMNCVKHTHTHTHTDSDTHSKEGEREHLVNA